MAFTYDSLKAYPIPEIEQSVTPDACILYSLSVGMGADPTDTRQLRYVYEPHLVANPLMANVLGYPGFWMKAKDTGVDWRRVLHGEQYFEVHRPLPVEGTVVGRTRIVGINDRGSEKGAFVYAERVVTDKATGEPICTISQTTVCRGDGGCGGADPSPHPLHQPPEREPDMICEISIAPQAALIYRLNGDRNPLHADPEVAQQAGYPQPILHGLCTLGHAGHAILRATCDYDPTRLKSMAVRFTAPVFPGETLRTELWREGTGLDFRSTALERDEVVLGNGRVELA